MALDATRLDENLRAIEGHLRQLDDDLVRALGAHRPEVLDVPRAPAPASPWLRDVQARAQEARVEEQREGAD
jgi:hypothetical protein